MELSPGSWFGWGEILINNYLPNPLSPILCYKGGTKASFKAGVLTSFVLIDLNSSTLLVLFPELSRQSYAWPTVRSGSRPDRTGHATGTEIGTGDRLSPGPVPGWNFPKLGPEPGLGPEPAMTVFGNGTGCNRFREKKKRNHCINFQFYQWLLGIYYMFLSSL